MRRVELIRNYGPHRAGRVVALPDHVAAVLCERPGPHGSPFGRYADEAPRNRMLPPLPVTRELDDDEPDAFLEEE